MFLSSSKANTWPTEIDLLLCAISYSPNLNKFVKVVCNVVFSSLWHSRGISLEGETHSMFVKWKLDGNSHKFDKDVYTINIPITNYLLPSNTSKFGFILHYIFGFKTKCWQQSSKQLAWRNSHQYNTLEVPLCSHNSVWSGDSIQGSNWCRVMFH